MRYLLTTLVLLLAINSQAQYQYVPMLTDSANWTYDAHLGISKTHTTRGIFHFLYKDLDTLINGKSYHQIYIRSSTITSPGNAALADIPRISNGPDSYIGGIREDNKKVYLINTKYNTERVIYDFNLSVGDTLPSNRYDTTMYPSAYKTYNIIDKIDTVVYGNKERKRFTATPITNGKPDLYYKYIVIEGIGSNGGIFHYEMYYSYLGFICLTTPTFLYDVNYPNALCAYIHEYGTPTSIPTVSTNEAINIYPNPTTDFVNIEAPNGTNITIYNSMGRKVISTISTEQKEKIDLEELPAGLYIINLHNEQAGLNEMRKIMKL